MTRKLIGRVGVDSGRLLIIDPFYLSGTWGEYNKIYGLDDNDELFEQLNYPLGHEGLGVVFRSGLGDGKYNVYGTFKEIPGWGTRITKVEIELIDEES
ncbi:hypothetical protein CathTA2_2422 [Caldalkalibacillus thermarum TA2.A1]|uniref:Uncharacterized protein n=1 Tax=Caldalkalibacillus thermarum (strain TA2.A1) TaxID=986075 RepID=F5L9B7_CALTT|nr:hypothetical protein [Caldalkalibacillus thermarum]EGL82059.1 hypothetical protein CathTA2_2422 [Caldalkalibacillus thermarum TA2.A1]QZT34022.1 hypothetical protein HUR95_00860 [Caldalkalibacillus thermarum TA2.A1]